MSVKELCIYATGTVVVAGVSYAWKWRCMSVAEYRSIIGSEVCDDTIRAAVLNVLSPATPGR